MRTEEPAPELLAALRSARPADPYVRWRAAPDAGSDLAIDGDHVAWTTRTARGERWATVMGEDPARALRLLASLDEQAPIAGITCAERVREHLPARLLGPDPGHWCLWLLASPTDLDPGAAIELPLDDPRIRPLLKHSSSAYVFPGDPRMVRWAGVERDGVLVAVAGQHVDTDGSAHLVSVCTAPQARGRGLARQVLSLLMSRALADGVPMVFLEMYADNEPGARLYRSLGFDEAGRYYSWLIGSGGEPPLA